MVRHARKMGFALSAAITALFLLAVITPARTAAGATLDELVTTDWAGQERRRDRSPGDPEAVTAAYHRAQALLRSTTSLAEKDTFEMILEPMDAEVARVHELAQESRLALYHRIRSAARRAVLSNPPLAGKPIIFVKRRRFICQMLHEYLGYFYDYGDISGGGVYVLQEPGRSVVIRDLIAGRLPKGNYTTLALSYDARTAYFAFAERAETKPDFYSPQRRCFHIYAVNVDGTNLRQLTDGPDDDFDPCPLPDGGIAFMSTRRGGFGRCHNPWEPLPSYTLHRMDASGQNVRTLSFHETNEWHPAVLNDGRIVYSRWDYVDRSAANYHGLWVSNPDGTNPAVLFGNYTQRINACFQPKAVPGSDKIAFIAGAHHADVGGALVLVDPDRHRLDGATAEDRFESIETLTPEVCFPEAAGWPDTYFHSPWPLSEDRFLVAFSPAALPGMGSNVKDDNYTGLYYFDRFGNLEFLYHDPNFSCMYPIPLTPRPTPPLVASALNPEFGEEGEYVLANVRESLLPLPASRPVRRLRIYQVLPKTATHVANQPRLGYANAESARMMLGTVPVEADGSAYFRAPARKPLYFQAVDDEGRALQTMRSVTYLQPGERRSCVGCHESPGAVSPRNSDLRALRRPPSRIEPGPEGTRPLSFPLLVQPVLDRHCVECHDASAGERKSPIVLTGESAGTFSRSYENLKPYVRWYEWGGASIHEIGTRPGQMGADESRLLRILDDENHARHVTLPPPDELRLCIWLDANAPFYGTYDRETQIAQKAGHAVPPPKLQ